jgi:WD40 repeat protein
MVSPEVHHLFHHPIADHSFSADRQTLAVARENNVDLYAREGSGFKLQDELTGHDKTVTGVDIAPNSGKIVTCSQGGFEALLTYQAANDLQIVTHTSGNPHLKAGSPRWCSSVSIALLHASVGLPLRPSSLSGPVPA